MSLNWLIGGGLSIWYVLSMLLPTMFGIKGKQLMLVRMGLTLAGTIGAALFAWYKKKKEQGQEVNVPGGKVPGGKLLGGDTEIDVVLKQAEQKLAASNLGPDARFRTMPVIFVTGPVGSTKTTSVVNSGLDPELLAGQVYVDGAIAPTQLANVWYGKQAVVVEAGPKLQGDANLWSRLIKRMAPGKLQSAMGKGEAPRAAVVCYECENFLSPNAAEKVGEVAKSIRGQLIEVSKTLGINVPVYVLFTKMDRIAFFLDYVRTLNEQEATQVLGMTLPIEAKSEGVYGEQESRRLSDSFHQLVLGLCDKRPEFLTRESDTEILPSTYEFPREFRKLRGPLVNFLLELCRPTPLSTGPFLRGFYFSGVRPVVVQEELAAEAPRGAQGGYDPGATRMFRYGEAQGRAATAPVSRMITKKVPQWVFLSHLFSEVILADRTGLAASGSSVKASLLRRSLFGLAAGLCLLFGVLTLISFTENKGLVSEVRDAAKGVTSDPNPAKLASVDTLTRLDTLRQALIKLRDYEDNGHPFLMGMGLYTGSALFPEARRLYFDRFKAAMFGDTQAGLLHTMQSWPPAPAPGADYNYPYNTLKAYLETTSNHDKAKMDFLPPLLLERWSAGQTVDPQRMKLARNQFDFYTSELILENPYSTTAEAGSVEAARKYLALFGDDKRIYQAFLSQANSQNKPINFNQRFPGSAEVVVDPKEVPGAFTKPGYAFMMKALADPNNYRNGEEWVLGPTQIRNPMQYQSAIRGYYTTDYIEQWREFIRKGLVVRYGSLPDAVKKLSITSQPDSPLMKLFWLAGQNTDVDPTVQNAFKPLRAMMPPPYGDNYTGQGPANYLSLLIDLKSSLDTAAKAPPEQAQATADQTATAATTALTSVQKMVPPYGVDPDGHIEKNMEKLLEDPITYAMAVKPEGPSPAPLNAAGAAFCGQYRSLMSKFPFNPASTAERATLDDVNKIFQPGQGALWTFYDSKLKKLLVKNGAVYEKTSEKPALTGRFVDFFNRAAGFSNALYGNGAAQTPKFDFKMKPAFTPPLQKVTLTVDGTTANLTAASPLQGFTWPGTGGLKLTASNGENSVSYPNYEGIWAVFEFFYDADKSIPNPEWRLKAGRSDKPSPWPGSDTPVVVGFTVEMSPPVFQKGYLQSLTCVAEVATK